MIHHVSIGSNHIGRSKAFYDAVLDAIGMRRLSDGESSLHYGSGSIEFSVETPSNGERATFGNGVHVAFTAEDRAMVDRFHAAGLAHGGDDAGSPGVRELYDPNYYAAFLFDPDGNKIEAVTFSTE